MYICSSTVPHGHVRLLAPIIELTTPLRGMRSMQWGGGKVLEVSESMDIHISPTEISYR